jgi:hypothetical protein
MYMYMDSSVENMIFEECRLCQMLTGKVSWVNWDVCWSIQDEMPDPEFFSMHRFSIDSGRVLDEYRQLRYRLSRLCMIWLLSTPYTGSKLDHTAHRKTEKERQLAHGKGGRG